MIQPIGTLRRAIRGIHGTRHSLDIDHSGLIPKLAKEGFKGKIYYTRATGELAEILLHDSAEIQTYESEYINKKSSAQHKVVYGPLYDQNDVVSSVKMFEVINYDHAVI